MNIFENINTNFIITLGITILLCGSIMYYSYNRLNILENSIIEHGKILQTFIVNSQQLNNANFLAETPSIDRGHRGVYDFN